MRPALLLLLLAAPTLGAAQTTTGNVEFTPDAFIGGEECGVAGETITATWASGLTGGVYDVYASSTRPTSETISRCGDDADLLLEGEAATTGGTLAVELPVSQLLTAAGLTCAETTQKTIFVCIEHFADESAADPDASDFGTVRLDVRKPGTPTDVRAEAGEEALYVFWTATDGAVDAVRWLLTATGPAEDPGPHERETNVSPREGYRFGGLRNGLTYSVTVRGISEAGTRGEPSGAASGTPTEVYDFWELYKNRNGREQGGCASGPGGLLAIAVVVALGALSRRRS